MKKRYSFLLIFLIVAIIFTGCSQNKEGSKETIKSEKKGDVSLLNKIEITEENITFEDALGDKQTINKDPKKVIVLYNSYMNLWYEAGGEAIARINKKSKLPEAAKALEVIGTQTEPNMEKIISLKPDLIILRPGMKGQKEIIPILKENEIPYIAAEYDNFEEYLYTMRIFTALTEHEELYEEKGLALKEEIEETISKVPQDKEPTALLMFASTRSVRAKLPNSFVGAMLKDLGVKNIAYDGKLTEEEMQVFSMEKIVERDPDYIFVQTMGDVEKIKDKLIEDVESNPAWNSLTAVKEGRYIFLDKELYLYKPNTRYAEAYKKLAQMLYPDTFK